MNHPYGGLFVCALLALAFPDALSSQPLDSAGMIAIPGGAFEMGDHHGFVDPSHPSDETPLHDVRVRGFLMARTETTNQLACALLNAASAAGRVDVRGGIVVPAGGTDTLLLLHDAADYYSIGWNGSEFRVVDARERHPVVGIMWKGAALLCNVRSRLEGLQECYDLTSWACDFSRDGYRLPTEAEWEFAGRGGLTSPYRIYPWGDDADPTRANWPASLDPYENGPLPHTTPVGFYDGSVRRKEDWDWPGSASEYRTSSGANAFGLMDMSGNVWEFVNDWYARDYYGRSPVDDPEGPTAGSIMPDGRAYRGMRGGNWYNGPNAGVNDGHSRVANRNPSYYRGPQDPNHPWYHIGFRFARRPAVAAAPASSETIDGCALDVRSIHGSLVVRVTPGATCDARVTVCDPLGRTVLVLHDGRLPAEETVLETSPDPLPSGPLYCIATMGGVVTARPFINIR